MALGMSTTLRNARLDPITTAVGNAGKVRLYDGTRPATGGTVTNLLAEFTMGSPFAPAASGAALSPTLPANTTGLPAAGAGTPATWARIVTSANAFVMDMSVTVVGGGGDCQLVGTTDIVNGQTVVMSSAVINEANA